MIKKHNILLFLFAFIFCFWLFGIFIFGHYVRWRYTAFIQDPLIVQLINDSDHVGFEVSLINRSFAFQKFEKGSIIYSSKEALPLPRILSVRTVISPQVIPLPIADSLEQQVPSTLVSGTSVYIFFPVVFDSNAESGYIVYLRVL